MMKQKTNNLAVALAFALLALLPLAGCATQAGTTVKPTTPVAASTPTVNKTPPPPPAVEMHLFLMSKCPFGVQALEKIFPVADQLGDHLKLRLDYIVNEKEGGFSALHGEPEVQGNKQQLCAQDLAPSPRAWRRFITCQNRTWRVIPEGWEACADEMGVKRQIFKACVDGEQGDALLRASMTRSVANKAHGSPTILVAGKPYQGPRTAKAFLRAVCGHAHAPLPAACQALPPEVEVHAVVLSDRRCGKACDSDRAIEALRGRFFPRLKVTNLDYGDPAGKQLFQQLALERLPAILFKAGVERAEQYPGIERWLQLRGTYRFLRVPATFDPRAEICDNGKDDTGNGKVDCKDPDCSAKLTCREEVPGRLDLFVMSQCPFGVKALDAMREVLARFKKIDFRVHYIAETKPSGGFSALHGQPEVEENIRQLCARKHFARGERYMRYIWCRNKNIRSEQWRQCATSGISARRIDLCVKRHGEQLLARDLKLARDLGIRASPTWLANNRHKFSGITAEAVRRNLCKHNPGLEGCEGSLSDEVKTPGAACGAADAQEKPKAARGDEDAVPAGPEAYRVGVTSCDDYIQKFLGCIRGKMPPETRPLLERALLTTARKWRAEVEAGKDKDSLEDGCAKALTVARSSLGEYGCSW